MVVSPLGCRVGVDVPVNRRAVMKHLVRMEQGGGCLLLAQPVQASPLLTLIIARLETGYAPGSCTAGSVSLLGISLNLRADVEFRVAAPWGTDLLNSIPHWRKDAVLGCCISDQETVG